MRCITDDFLLTGRYSAQRYAQRKSAIKNQNLFEWIVLPYRIPFWAGLKLNEIVCSGILLLHVFNGFPNQLAQNIAVNVGKFFEIEAGFTGTMLTKVSDKVIEAFETGHDIDAHFLFSG